MTGKRKPWYKTREGWLVYGTAAALGAVFLIMRLLQETRVDDYLLLPVR